MRFLPRYDYMTTNQCNLVIYSITPDNRKKSLISFEFIVDDHVIPQIARPVSPLISLYCLGYCSVKHYFLFSITGNYFAQVCIGLNVHISNCL